MRTLQERLREDAAANEAIADDCPEEADRYVTARLQREAADYIDAMHAATGRRHAKAPLA